MTDTTEEPPVAPVHVDAAPGYLIESSQLRTQLINKRNEALTLISSIDSEIAEKRNEIEARLVRRADLVAIVEACEAGATVINEVVPPQISVVIEGAGVTTTPLLSDRRL